MYFFKILKKFRFRTKSATKSMLKINEKLKNRVSLAKKLIFILAPTRSGPLDDGCREASGGKGASGASFATIAQKFGSIWAGDGKSRETVPTVGVRLRQNE